MRTLALALLLAGAPAAAQRSMTFRVTTYCVRCSGRTTATGTRVRPGVAAVDPRVIPLGSWLKVDGFAGRLHAEDTGGRVKGRVVDVWVASPRFCRRFGAQHRRVLVWRARR